MLFYVRCLGLSTFSLQKNCGCSFLSLASDSCTFHPSWIYFSSYWNVSGTPKSLLHLLLPTPISFFFFFLKDRVLLCSSGWPLTHAVLLPQCPELWDYSSIPPFLTFPFILEKQSLLSLLVLRGLKTKILTFSNYSKAINWLVTTETNWIFQLEITTNYKYCCIN